MMLSNCALYCATSLLRSDCTASNCKVKRARACSVSCFSICSSKLAILASESFEFLNCVNCAFIGSMSAFNCVSCIVSSCWRIFNCCSICICCILTWFASSLLCASIINACACVLANSACMSGCGGAGGIVLGSVK